MILIFFGASFIRKSNLNTHIAALDDKDTTHQCDVCGASFKGKGDLGAHIASVHSKEKNLSV